MARPADPVTDRLAAHKMRGLERPKLLENARPAGPDPFGELVRGAGSVESKTQEQVASQARWPFGSGLSKAGGDVVVRRFAGGRQRRGLPHSVRLAPASQTCCPM